MGGVWAPHLRSGFGWILVVSCFDCVGWVVVGLFGIFWLACIGHGWCIGDSQPFFGGAGLGRWGIGCARKKVTATEWAAEAVGVAS